MTTAALATATIGEGLTYQDALLDVVGRARNGDTDALAYVFDSVFYDVYHHVFLVTRDRHEAERATRRALDRLPSMLRRRCQTLTELRDGLVYQARQTSQGRGVRRRHGGPAGGNPPLCSHLSSLHCHRGRPNPGDLTSAIPHRDD